MTSGIYKLTFPSGHYYIGKSIDIERRWKEHFDKLRKGTAAKNMQDAYNAYGFPETEIIFYCHSDHIDLMEGFCIRKYSGPGMLNSAGVPSPSDEDVADMDKSIDGVPLLSMSTAEHCRQIVNAINIYNSTSNTLDKLKKETGVGKLEEEKMYWIQAAIDRQTKIDKLKNRGFFARLFNLEG